MRRKTSNILKDILPSFISVFALIVAFFAFREARLANKLNIDPFITFQYQRSFKGYKTVLFIINEGNISVKNLEVAWVALRLGFPDKESKELTISPIIKFLRPLKANNKLSFSINLEGIIELSKTEVIKSKAGKDIFVEKGQMIFLGLKAKYRRIYDSKLFEKKTYLVLLPRISEIIVGDIKELMIPEGGSHAAHYLDIINNLLNLA